MSTNATPYRPTNAWTRFWFTAADPTTLGFMRVVTGLLILYIHAAYSLDLQAFFGKDGWYNTAAMQRERTEFPWMLTPFFGEEAWREYVPAAHVPLFPHRREAVMDFIRGLPSERAERAMHLAYLTRLQKTQNLLQIRDGLMYFRGLPEDSRARSTHLDAMVNKSLRTSVDLIPTFLDNMNQEGPDSRATVKKEIEQLYQILPQDGDRRRYVVDHLLEQEYSQRQMFLDFLDRLPADPVKRASAIEYLDFWNNEREKAYVVGQPTFSLWFHITDPQTMAVAHGCVLVIMVMFTLGLFTRVTAVLTWLAAISYIQRTQQVLFGMDTMMNILLIYLMIGNCGQALSLDRLINRYRAARNSLSRTGTIDAATRSYLDAPPKSVAAAFAYRMVQIHFCFIYMAAGMSKLKGAAWWNHNAFWDTLINPEFTWVHFQWYESLLRTLMSERWIYSFYAAGGIAFTFIMELGLPFLVWTRLRPFVVIGAMLLHLGIAVFMGLILFGLLMMTLLLGYIPGQVIREQFRGASDAVLRMTLRFNGRSPQQLRAAALATALDTDGQLELVDTSSTELKLTVEGKELTGDQLGEKLFGTLAVSRIFWLLLFVPVIGGMLTRLLAPKEATEQAKPRSQEETKQEAVSAK